VKALDSQIFLSNLQNAKPTKTGGRNLGSVVDGVLHVGMYQSSHHPQHPVPVA
jgi:hypothetical protein